jgi:hypothetical protein
MAAHRTHRAPERPSSDWRWVVFVACVAGTLFGLTLFGVASGSLRGRPRDLTAFQAWLALGGSVVLGAQTVWTTSRGYVYAGRSSTVRRADDRGLYWAWVAVQWAMVGTLGLLGASMLFL